MSDVISFDRIALLRALDLALKVRPWRRQRPPPAVGEAPSYRPQPPAVVRIAFGDSGATITSANLDVSIAVDVACTGQSSPAFVPCDALHAALTKAVSDRVDLAVAGITTTLTAGRFKVKLQGEEMDALPSRQAPAAPAAPIDVSVLREGLGETSDAIGSDAKQPMFGGVYAHETASGLSFVAMDGSRIHARAMMDGSRIHARAILPRRLVDLLQVALPAQGEAEMSSDARSVSVSCGPIRIVSALLLGTYPSYEAELNRPTDRVLWARASALLADLDVVATVSNPRDRDIRLDLGRRCVASAFRVNALDCSPASGEIDLEVEYAGGPLAIGLQMHLVRDALAQFGDRLIEWRMAGPQDPTFITSPEAPGLRILVSPFLLRTTHMLEAA